MSRERLFIVDAFAHIFRAYYAIRNIDHNAVYGFTAMLRKLIDTEKPEYLAVAFDSPGDTFRKEIYPEYKANRQAAPEDLLPQIPLIKEVVEAFNIPLIELPRYEADDIIGTLSVKAAEAGLQAVIVSGDKDMLQLVKGDEIVMYDANKGVHYLGEAGIPEFFGCRPNQIIDLLTIWGDSSDNIPGVAGVGEKGAKQLLEQYGSIEQIYEHLDEIKRKAYREGFEKARGQLELTRKLVTIRTDLDIPFNLEDLKLSPVNAEKTTELFTRLNFKSLLDSIQMPLKSRTIDYELVDTAEKLERRLADIRERGFVVFDIETTSLDPCDAELVGVALATEPGNACYIPLRHQGQDPAWTRTGEELLRPMFADPEITKCAHNAKYDYSVLTRLGFEMEGDYEDTMLMSYLLSPNNSRHGLDHLAEEKLRYRTIHFEEVCGSGADQITFDKADINKACQYAAEDADVCIRLYNLLMKELKEHDLVRPYEVIERPLVPVLCRMELAGIEIDKNHLAKMSEEMGVRIEALEKEIYALAGEEFNIKSTKQLGEILFEKLGLPTQGKTSKTKSFSTSQDVLEKLAALGHELPKSLLEYRMLTKLKSTYVDALPSMIHPVTGRVHSSFNQFVAATGRLSSANPNLQNIPIKNELGREIRAAFKPQKGWLLVAADYSQVELRLMAHFSEDKTLVNAFKSGEDIHRRTAGEIMDVMPETVTDEQRRMAKSINFGLIYGMGEFRLSQELGITRKQAKSYIEAYFKKMPGVPTFRDKIIAQAKKDSEITTYFGHKRPLPEINSRNKNLQNQGERLAVNTLIQGTAAEMIKLAMIRLDKALQTRGLKARILLQVHDELVLECPESECAEVSELLQSTMETVVDFSVPFPAEVHTGYNWKEAK